MPMGKGNGEDRRKMGRQYLGMDSTEFCKIIIHYRGQENMEKAGCKVFCGAPMTKWLREHTDMAS